MFGADSRLSEAASAIYSRRSFVDPYDEIGRANDCGPLIDAGNERFERETLAAFGFTPGSYNAELRSRLAPEFPKMSHSTYTWLSCLEVDECEECGGPVRHTTSGFDPTAVTTCLSCGTVRC